MSNNYHSSDSSEMSEEVFEEEDFNSLDEIERMQAQPRDDSTQPESDMESHSPDRPRSPIMWEHSPTVHQQVLQAHSQNLPAPTEHQILDHIVFGGPLHSRRLSVAVLQLG